MSGLLAKLRLILAYEPAAASWALNGGIALLCAYAFGLTKTEEAAVATIVTALAAIYTAVRAKPATVPAIIGALTTAVTAAAAFGFHPSANIIAIGTSVASIVLSLVFRVNLTPKAAMKRPVPVPGHP
jgi:hypothetical protein